ncbi:MAG TPA: flagellin, partial [Geminicoccaceae bacterium]|nr:flagellin [Geminicoccaceae bacterium]
MPLNVVSNYAANVAHRNLQMTDSAAARSLAKLSIGQRVVSARDDAASMAVGSRLNAEVQGLKQAVVNAGQANSMLQIADGAMGTVSDILTRMKTLAIQSSSGNL